MAKSLTDPGIGYSSKRNAQRIIIDGKSNLRHIHNEKTLDNLYSYLIEISWLLFLTYVIIGYILVNVFFALIYYYCCPSDIVPAYHSLVSRFLNLVFFSAQTITTVGYGGMTPHSIIGGVISSLEALVGLMSFSFITGLLYGRFSKPTSKVKFSDFFVIREYEGKLALMFRLMNDRKNMLIEPELQLTMAITKHNKGTYERQFFQLPLQRSKIVYLPSMWTVVHIIDEDSPLFDYSKEELEHLQAEMFILLKYHEQTFNQHLYQIHSYGFNQLKYGYKFGDSYRFDSEGYTVVDHQRLNKLIKL